MTHFLHGVDVGHTPVRHVTGPWPRCPGARFRFLVDQYLRTIRAQVAVIAGIGMDLARGHLRGFIARLRLEPKELAHVHVLGPGDVASVLGKTAQCALVTAVRIRMIADFRFLAQGAEVAVSLL